MLKLSDTGVDANANLQPPLGGCVLKHDLRHEAATRLAAAAFRRLCVETQESPKPHHLENAAAFRRLCVETVFVQHGNDPVLAAAFRRLCVETWVCTTVVPLFNCSRL